MNPSVYHPPIRVHEDQEFDQYYYTGYNIIDSITLGERVLAINCGNNPLKNHIPNFVGQDPQNDNANFVGTLSEYVLANGFLKFNTVLALDSTNFQDVQLIEDQIVLIKKVLRERDTKIFWRCDPATSVWTFDLHQQLSSKFDFHITELTWENNGRIFSLWESNNRSSDIYPT